MRYDDASQTGSSNDHVEARDDTAHLAGNNFGPTAGNLITGAGTVSGSAGADMSGPGAHITAISGVGGSDNTFDAQGHLEVAGQYGTLTIDASGNYTYVRTPGSPEGVSDTFTYTLADAAGSSDQAKLVIAIGNPPMLNAQGSQTIQTANGAIVLPAGVELSDVHVEGRNLVITLPDGSTMVIPDGAVFVPQLVVNGVEVPASNLAALLIDSEPKPAAGDVGPNQLSSGGNFELPVAPLDPGVPLGDLIPPTELNYTPPEFKDIFPDEHNQAPSIGLSSVNVSEEGVSSVSTPIPDNVGSPDTTDLRIVNGHISVSDPDGDALSVVMGVPVAGLTSQGVAITWSVSADGHTVTGSAGANTVITIALNNAGDYTVTLARPVDHPTGGGEQGSSFVIPVTVSDGQETTGGGGITVTIEDDSPVVSGVQVRGGVTLDETSAGSAAGFPISGTTADAVIVNSSGGFGADGPAASGSITYGLGLTGGVSSLASGIVTANGDFPITLVQTDSATIQGQYTNGGTQVAFTVHMNANGTVTLTQNVALEHLVDGPPGPAHDDSLSLNGLVNATVIYKDFDGDTASGAAPIGGNLIFKDDGPSVDGAHVNSAVVLDETDGAEPLSAGAPITATSAAAMIVGNAVNYGADGQGPAPAYGLTLLGGVSSLDSGLRTALGDHPITLTLTSSTLITATYEDGGTHTAFTIQMNANGTITVTQSVALEHNIDGSTPAAYDDSLNLLNGEQQSLVNATVTYQDSDGDTASASAAIGNAITFKDDGPSINITATGESAIELITGDAGTQGGGSTTASSTVNFSGVFAIASQSGGGDGTASAGILSYQLSTIGGASGLQSHGADVNLYMVGGTVVGAVGTQPADLGDPDIIFTVSVDGNGVVTLTQLQQIDHAAESPSDFPFNDETAHLGLDTMITLTASATITDNDGDTASDSETINIGSNLVFRDDGPSISIVPAAEPNLIVDETDLPIGAGPVSFIDSFSFDFGADGPAAAGSKLFSLSVTEGPSGLVDTLTHNQVYLFFEAGVVVGREGTSALDAATGEIVFKVTVDAATGDVSLEQDRAVVHSDPTDPDEADTPAMLSADDLIKLNVTLKDYDGDTASASINIARNLQFQDDGPSAQNEAQQDVNEGTTKTGTFDFIPGNDGATVTHINGTALVFDSVTHWSQWIVVDDGQIRAMANGAYEFQANLNGSGVTSGTFTVTDGDGDPATANWAFNILDIGSPTAGTSQALLDDEGLANGIAGGTGDIDANAGEVTPTDSNEAVFHGDLHADFGADGAGTISFAEMVGQFRTVGTERVHFTWDAGTLTLRAIVDATDGVNPQARAGTELFKLVLDPSLNGNYTLTLEANVIHATGGNETSAPDVGLAFHIVDSDNSPAGGAAGTLNVTFNDDMPSLGAASGVEPTITVDETNLASNSTGDFSAVLGAIGAGYGADGAGTTVYALHISGAGTASGLFDVASGNQIYLYQVGDTIVGKVGSGVATPNPSGATSFVVSVNGSGVVTLDQQLAIQHSPDSGPDQPASMANDALISLSLTITDSDGDAVSSSVNIASNLVFKDDAPSIGLNSTAEPIITVDETNLATDNTGDFSGNFSKSYGADGAGTTTYALSPSGVGVDSGLIDVASGQHIYLYSDGSGGVVGRVGAGGVANPAGAISFTATVDAAGVVTLDQRLAMQHSPDAGPDQPVSIANDTLIKLTATITDKDGDSATASINIASNLVFKDDAPSIGVNSTTEPTITVDETNLATDNTGDFSGNFGKSYGADGAGTTTYALSPSGVGVDSGLIDVASGQHIFLYSDGAGGVVGRVGSGGSANPAGAISFAVTVDGSGVVTLDQRLAMQHSPDTGPDQPVSMTTDSLIKLTATITDKDGDSATASINIGSNLIFKDDAPSIAVNSTTEPTITVDETNLASDSTGDFSGNFGKSYGADGAGTTTYALSPSGVGVDSGLIDVASGQHIFLYSDGAGGVVGRVGSGGSANPAGAISFAATVNSSGVVTLDQRLAIQHSPDTGPDQSVSMTTDSLIKLTATITDKDGDSATASINIASNLVFKDDAPHLGAASGAEPTITVDETNLASNSTGDFSAVLGAIGAGYGADGAGTTVYSLSVSGTGVDSGLIDVASGQHIYLYKVSDSLIEGRVGSGGVANPAGAVAFNVTVNGSGVVTLDQVLAIQHSPDTGPDQPVSMATDSLISLALTVTDKDGDAVSSSVNIASNLVFKDDAPHLGASSGVEPTITVDETNLASNSTGDFSAFLGAAGAGYGADGAGTTVYSLNVSGTGVDSGLIDVASGEHIFLYKVSDSLVEGRVGSAGVANPAGAVAFSVAVNGSGVVTLDQVLALQHSPDTGPDQSVSMTTDSLINLKLTVTDKDGDAVSSSVNIASNLVFKDDAPHVGTSSGSEPTITVDETNLASDSTGNFAAVLGFAGSGYGADGAGTTVFNLDVSSAGAASGLFDVASGNQIYLYKVGNTIVGKVGSGVATPNPAGATSFVVSVDASGVVTLDQQLAILHSPDTGPDQSVSMTTDSLISLSLVVTDKDGDAASSSVNIASNLVFKDDAPTALHAAAIASGLNNGGNSSASANLDGAAPGNGIVSDNFGADGAGKVIFASNYNALMTAQNLTHGGTALKYALSPDGQTLTGYVDTTPNDVVDAGETVFTIQLQTGVDGNFYTVTMVQTLDTVQTIDFNNGGYDFVGGNGSWAGFRAGTDTDDSLDLLLTPMVNGNKASTMNTNANEGGVGSGNSVSLGEGVRVDTVNDLKSTTTPTSSGDYGILANQNHLYDSHTNVIGISGLISTVNGNASQTTNINLIARDENVASDANTSVGDGPQETITKVVVTHGTSTVEFVKTDGLSQTKSVDGHNVQVVFGTQDATVNSILAGTRIGAFTNADGYDSLEFKNVGGQEFKIGDFNTLALTNGPVNFTAPIAIQDRDGDTVDSGNLAIHVNGSTPPVVLDLNGDGVHFLGQNAGVHFDYGAGLASTAWAASDDGILVRDANHDGNVSGSEMVFGGNGVTDMEALHAQYGDQLDANDADFTQFAVWNDANSNGVVDANELHSLAEAGIASINLVSDGISYTAANGDVQVAGTATYTRADGSTGDAADASFATGSAAKANQEVERIAANSNNVALAAAVAAAGIVASTAAAASTPSFDAHEAVFTNAVVGKFAYAGSDSVDTGSHFSAFSALSGGGFEASALPMASASHTAIATAHVGELTAAMSMGGAPTALLDATDFSNIVSAQAMPTAMGVAMPSLHGLVAGASGMEALPSALNVQHAGVVEQIVAEALHGGSAGQDINALLNTLPGAGLGEIAGLHGLASPVGADVSTWDTGHSGGFTYDVANIMTNPAMVLHHDAVQPVANG